MPAARKRHISPMARWEPCPGQAPPPPRTPRPDAELCDFSRDKRTAGSGARGGGRRHRMGGGTAQVGPFRTSAAHNGRDTLTVMRVTETEEQSFHVALHDGGVCSGAFKTFIFVLKVEIIIRAQFRKSFWYLNGIVDYLQNGGDQPLTKTMANFSSSSVGSGIGTFSGMM